MTSQVGLAGFFGGYRHCLTFVQNRPIRAMQTGVAYQEMMAIYRIRRGWQAL